MSRTYRCVSYNPINYLGIQTVIFALLVAVLGVIISDFFYALIWMVALFFFMNIFLYLISYAKVTRHDDAIILQDINKTILLDNVKDISTWWAYEFGGSTPLVNAAGPVGKMQAHGNKINIFVKFEAENDTAYIFEQIYLGTKFPNNHPYIQDTDIDTSKLIQVWDVDKCLAKLGLEET